jgi:hypothetical protein
MSHRTGWTVGGFAAVALVSVAAQSGTAGASANVGRFAPRSVPATPRASALPFDPSQRGGADVVNATPPSGHRCAKVTRRSVRGTIRGQDSLAMKAQIGFDIVDAKGQKVDLATGCALGAEYSAWANLNLSLHTDGVPFGTPLTSKTYVGDSFVLKTCPRTLATSTPSHTLEAPRGSATTGMHFGASHPYATGSPHSL